MKKKHLNGKLSLKVKDLSALDNNQSNAVGGGSVGLDCSYHMICDNATNYQTCTIAGNSVNQCYACAPTYEYRTCPPNAGCATTNVTAIC